MKFRSSRAVSHAVLIAVAFATAVHADVSGTWVGQLTSRRAIPAVSATLSQAGRRVTGTVTVEAGDPGLGGAYTVQGVAVGAHLRASGVNAAGAHLALRAVVATDAANGRLRLGIRGSHLAGKLALTRQTATTGGPNCDTVFTANQAFFTTQVQGQVLGGSCVACHTAGGLAQSTRLRVTPNDPAATARATALLVNQTTPASSLLLTKPTALVSHGGGAQLAAGGPQVAILQQWVDMLVQSGCLTSGGGGGGGGDPYTDNCASCHGGDASGTATAPDIRCTAASQITAVVRNGRRAMPAFSVATLDAAALQSITTKLDSLCSGQPADVYAANCASCHGASAASVACEGGVADVVLNGGNGMPAFPDLGGARLRALAAYVTSLCRGGGGGD